MSGYHVADELARAFYTLRAERFGQSPLMVKAILLKYFTQGASRTYFESLSTSLTQWEREGFPVDPGDYFRALFTVFGESTYPSHVIAECGLRIYIEQMSQNIRPEPPLSPKQIFSYREERISEVMVLYGMSREEAIECMAYLLPPLDC